MINIFLVVLVICLGILVVARPPKLEEEQKNALIDQLLVEVDKFHYKVEQCSVYQADGLSDEVDGKRLVRGRYLPRGKVSTRAKIARRDLEDNFKTIIRTNL